MALDSDVHNSDSHLHVEFYLSDAKDYKGKPFVRIIIPGDKTNIIEQEVREDHKERFPRQWLYFQMQGQELTVIGTPLSQWHKDDPENFTRSQAEEMQILKFQTVEQIALASDAQLQRVGMGALGLRERARTYITGKNKTESATELDKTRGELNELKEQMAILMAKKPSGRPKKLEA